jgi:predicted Ser/Thr protein kinase
MRMEAAFDPRDCTPTRLSLGSAPKAPIAQWIERCPPKAEVVRSNRTGCAIISIGHTTLIEADDATRIMRAGPATLVVDRSVAAAPPANVFDEPTLLVSPGARLESPTVLAQPVTRQPRLPDAPLPSGTVLNKRYEVLKAIGRGGFSYVYLCQHLRNGRLNAVKEAYFSGCGRVGTSVVSDGDTSPWPARTALMREVSAISRVSHPGVVRFEDAFEENDTLYFAMDFVEGEPLSTLLGRRGGVSDATFQQIAGALLDAVDRLHENDVMHGDIKPANIVVRPDKSIVLIDFGSAERLSDIHYTSPVVTAGYSPVERYREESDLGAWSDVYSCAATFGATLTGCPPPPAPDVLHDPSRLSDFLSQVARRSPEAKRWSDAMAGALIPSIGDRTASARQLREAMGLGTPRKDNAHRGTDGHSVFVSYSHRDAEIVEAHVKALQLRGVGVWIDRQGIKPGSAAWGGDIVRGIRDSQIVLVFSSRHSMASENVTRELYLAEKLRKKIVVALLDETPFSDDVSIFLTPTQHVRTADMDQAAFARAVVQILDHADMAAAA